MTPPPPDSAWLPAVARWAGAPAAVTARAPLAGGYVAAAVERVDLDAGGRPVPVVLKRTGPSEVAAMRAIAVVPGVDRPRLLAAGQDRHGAWLVMPFYAGPALAVGEVPSEVWDVLGRVHAHWHRRRPRGLPVVDAHWWWGMVTGHTLPAVRGARDRTGDARLAEIAELLDAWSTDARLRAALALLPRTLTHGDAHRGNVLLDPDGAVLIDWGNARIAPAGLDVGTLAAQGVPAPEAYVETTPEALREVERLWAQVQVHVQYLGFAADHLGAARVVEMVETAARALDELGPALARCDHAALRPDVRP
ncbi:aminoglycoside phosphotransferase family protein [Pseudonocardia cypriaca]|uniref:Phosphotransferase family enzyme n=1 Tax=Pseudonocardia cypriaca TaxID=882449 RepID=A0A543GAC6_9PSEU|nr:phosphotransferase [Pseudonocardia cypriaca]TQM43035.1 phosphotransferase family enzyme [Pseudonocardia cypriaca]